MQEEEINVEWHNTLFGVRRSARYHTRREAYFSGLYRFTAFTNLVLGSSVFATVASNSQYKSIALLAGAAIALLSGWDLVRGFAENARKHSDLKRRFVALETSMLDAPKETLLRKCQAERLAIEADEPPKMHALDIMCHNELLTATGYDPKADAAEYCKVGWFKRKTANLFRWSGSTFPRGN